jgi:hypothetical protein
MGKISEMIWRWRRHVELNWIEWGGRHGREGQRHVQVDVYDLSESCQVSKVVAGWWRGRLVTGDWWVVTTEWQDSKEARTITSLRAPFLLSLSLSTGTHEYSEVHTNIAYLFIYLLIHAINFIFTFKLLFVDIQ